MNYEQEASTIAKYALVQQAINNASSLIIQVFGFSLAAIIALSLASLQTKTAYILFFVIVIIDISALYVSVKIKSITETEAYIVVFIESEIQNFSWRKTISEKHQQERDPNKKYLHRSPLSFSDFAPFAYAIILFLLIIFLISNDTFFGKNFNSLIINRFLIVLAFTSIFLVLQSIKYIKEDYYSQCKKYFEKQKERIQSLNPSQAKLVDRNGKELSIPESTYQVLCQVTEIIASGQGVSIVPKKREVTTQEAADFLNVSYSFLIKLLEEGKIPYIKEGAHRRIHFQDLMRYQDQRNLNRREGLQELTQFLQDEGFYDEESFEFEQ